MNSNDVNFETGLVSNQSSELNKSKLESKIGYRDEDYIHYLYKITNKTNGKYYIGVHSFPKDSGLTPETDNYWGSGTEIREAIHKEGKSNFKKEVLKTFSTRQELSEAERKMVTIDEVKDPNCYNRVHGGGKSPIGKISVRLKDGSNKRVLIDREEFYNNRELYLSDLDNQVLVQDKTSGKEDWISISKDEYNSNKDRYNTTKTGKVTVYELDDNGEAIKDKALLITEEEYYKFKNIKYIAVCADSTLNKVVVFKKGDQTRKAVVMDKNDPRYLSGEYIGVANGLKQSEKTIAKKTGEKNGSFGSTWITNGKKNKKIYDNNIPDGWRKGRVFPSDFLDKVTQINREIVDSKKREVEILNKISGNIIKVKLNPKFIKNNGELITPEFLLSLLKSEKTWMNVSRLLGLSYKSIKIIKDYYISLGYKFEK